MKYTKAEITQELLRRAYQDVERGKEIEKETDLYLEEELDKE